MPLSCTLKKGQNVKFYAVCILPQVLKPNNVVYQQYRTIHCTWGWFFLMGPKNLNYIYWKWSCSCCLVAKSCLTLLWPMDGSPPGASVHGIFQARILEWVAMPSSRSSRLRDQTHVSCISRLHKWILHCWATREAGKWRDALLNNSWIKKKKREIANLLGSNNKDNMSPKPCTQWVCMQRKVSWVKGICDQTRKMRNFPDSPVVNTLCFQCIECGFDPWTGS